MLFETDQKRPVKINGTSTRSSLQKNAAPVRPAPKAPGTSKPPVRPVQKNPPVTGKSIPQPKPPVRGAGYTPIKKAPPTAANVTQRRTYPGTAAKPIQQVPTGYYRSKPMTSTTRTRQPNLTQQGKGYNYTAAGRVMQPATRQAYYYPRTWRPVTAASVNKTGPRRTYGGAFIVRKSQQIPGRRVYYPGNLVNQPYYRNGYTRPPVNKNAPASVPGRYVPGYGYCTPESPVTQVPAATSVNQQVTTSVAMPTGVRKPACHTCGSRTKGCTTLSRFAHNSAQLNITHKRQIREMALSILRNHTNAVIATGHTDKSGSNSFNKALGARRAGAVIRELRKQLSILKPNAHKNLLWRIVTRGEERPISRTDAAANRRVHLCLRKVRPAA